MRPDGRRTDELRPITITPDFNRYAEGSALIAFGETHVICTASVEEKVPGFLEGQGKGWVTAEYAMLPRATHTRSGRAGGGRGQEIQRLIGRSLRAAIDPRALGPRQITIDCDVIQADGGTRTAAITGGYVALALAVRRLQKAGKIGKESGKESGKQSGKEPLRQPVAAISAGIIDGEARVDLPYVEDSQAEVDCNFVMTGDGRFVEIQATAEKGAFSADQYGALVALAAEAMKTLFARQREAIERARP
jgi:ribonuclease PH